MRISVSPDLEGVRDAVAGIEGWCIGQGLADDVVFHLQLSMDELLTNIVSYGFEEGAADQTITVDMRLDESEVELLLRDNGRPFNPLEDAATPDVDLSVEDRPIGGLGIFLTKQFIRTLAYRRAEGFNCLTLKQPRSAAEPGEQDG